MSERESNWDDRLEYAAVSDIGMRRANNQDSMAVVLAANPEAWQQRGHLFMVADGMGAHAAGELASKLAVDGIAHLYHKYVELPPAEALQRAIQETNSEVYRRGQANADFRNMGTTVSTMLLLPQGVLVAHIGDSRIYRLRGDRLEQLTRDHSLLWELRAAGQLSLNGDLAHSIPRNVITRSLGPNASVQIDFEGLLDVRVGDTFLLCSDGLTGKIEDEELATILAHLPPEEAARLLVDLANLRGGPDNITVIVPKVVKPGIDASETNSSFFSWGGARRKPISSAAWVSIAVCLLIALIDLITHRFMWAAVTTVAAGLCYLAGLYFARRAVPPSLLLGSGDQLGKAPYTVSRCPSRKEAARLLAGITRNLRQADVPEGLPLDWETFDANCRAAVQVQQAGQLDDAIRDYAKAIRVLMQQVRDAQRQNASDSAIDY